MTRAPIRVLLGLATLLSLPGLLGAVEPASGNFLPIQARMDALVAAHQAPSISVAAISGGHVVWSHSSGWADIGTHKRATTNTVYRIGSASKSITATIAAIAAARGDVDLSRPATSYLPALPHHAGNDFTGVTLDQLIDMQAGLQQSVYYRDRDADTLKLSPLEFLDRYAVRASFDANRYSYSNVGPALVAQAIVAGKAEGFAHYAHRVLFAPLGMTRTYLSVADVPPGNQARSYRIDGKPFEREFNTYPAAGAGMLASLNDLTRYALFHLGAGFPGAKAPLNPEQLSLLHRPRTAGYYGSGWGVFSSDGYVGLVSDGQVNGGQAMILLEPGRGLAVVALSNVANDAINDLAVEAMNAMAPGFAAAFQKSREQLGAAYEMSVKGFYPDDPGLTLEGTIDPVGAMIPFHARSQGADLEITMGDRAPVLAKKDDPDAGFLRWQIPCPDALPACAAPTEPTAWLYLTRSNGQVAGHIYVESQLGAFPYSLVIAPVIPPAAIDESMKMFNRSLGVECTFCHVDKDWKDTSKPQWATARNMWRMVQVLNTDALANTNGITCMTCHGGRNKPERLPAPSWQALADQWPSALSDDRKLAMSVYSASLGVGCEHCHDPADWTSTTKPAFATAQRMNAMFEVFPRFMPAGARTQCYMCHKGSNRPAGSR